MRKNLLEKYTRIQSQFKERINEKTTSGASASFRSVVQTLSEEWCLSEASIERIILMKLPK